MNKIVQSLHNITTEFWFDIKKRNRKKTKQPQQPQQHQQRPQQHHAAGG